MDKQTLSNYGWVIITVLVLAVMIALATPFGSYIKEGAKSTLTGLFESSENALNTGLSEAGVTIDKAEFGETPTINNKEDEATNFGSVTFSGYLTGSCNHQMMTHQNSCYTNEQITLTWEELKLLENGEKYGYNASEINDTNIPWSGWFNGCKNVTEIILPSTITIIEDYGLSTLESLNYVVLPNSLIKIGEYAFSYYQSNNIYFNGTIEQWNNISKIGDWCGYSAITQVVCTDGTVPAQSN